MEPVAKRPKVLVYGPADEQVPRDPTYAALPHRVHTLDELHAMMDARARVLLMVWMEAAGLRAGDPSTQDKVLAFAASQGLQRAEPDSCGYCLLRIACAEDSALSGWWVAQETLLFLLRASQQPALVAQLVPERVEQNYRRDDCIAVPIADCPVELDMRMAQLRAGLVLVPVGLRDAVAAARFTGLARRGLAEARIFIARKQLHDGLYHSKDLVAAFCRRFMAVHKPRQQREAPVAGPALLTTAASAWQAAESDFPLCVVVMLRYLRKAHRLDYEARFHLGSFLRDAGLPVAENVALFVAEAPEKDEYPGVIKSYYTKAEQGSASATKHCRGCAKIVSMVPSGDSVSSCPYGYLPLPDIENLLVSCGVPDEGRRQARQHAAAAQKQRPGEERAWGCKQACRAVFESTHPDKKQESLFRRPNEYLVAARAQARGGGGSSKNVMISAAGVSSPSSPR